MMTALQEVVAAVQNQRFATGNDDALLARAITELLERVEASEAKLKIYEAMAEQEVNEAPGEETSEETAEQ